MRKEGCNIETVSKGEVKLALKAGFKPQQIIFTCSNIDENEIKFLIKNKILMNLDSSSQTEIYGRLNPGGKVGIRINQGIGSGHHKHCVTGGPKSKFGIYFSDVKKIKKIAERYNLKIIGIHQHIGSGILDKKIILKAMKLLLKTAKNFENLEYVDFGGGFGIPYGPDEKPLDLKTLGKEITNTFKRFSKNYGKDLKMIFEPGRYLVAEAGTLLAKIVDIKKTPYRTFVGINTGFNHLLRPAMYGSYHEILNASCIKGKKIVVDIAGNVCESGDVFARKREIKKPQKGDILAIRGTGAYGFSMSSNYNTREKPAEILIDKGDAKKI